LGWRWIFFVNLPVDIIGLALAVWLIPALPTQRHRFDFIGVILSGAGLLLIVFALQEGQAHDWALWIWSMIVAGVGLDGSVRVLAVRQQERAADPLRLFSDRDFSLCNFGVAVIAFVLTGLVLPVMFTRRPGAGCRRRALRC
jgi:hypothetical protein